MSTAGGANGPKPTTSETSIVEGEGDCQQQHTDQTKYGCQRLNPNNDCL